MRPSPPGWSTSPPEPADRVRALTHLLAAAYPGCPPYGGEFPDPQPHLTVTTAPVPEMVEWTARIERDLVPVTVTVASLTLLEQQPDARWRVTGTLPLTRPGPPHHRAAPRIGLP